MIGEKDLPIVLVHGTMGKSEDWSRVVEELSNSRSVIVKHAPNVPQCAAAFEKLFLDAGAPKGVYTNVYISNEQAATALTDDLSILVQRAVMAPDISKVDPDRHLELGLPAWDFRDEMLRWLFHGNSLSDPKDLLPRK